MHEQCCYFQKGAGIHARKSLYYYQSQLLSVLIIISYCAVNADMLVGFDKHTELSFSHRRSVAELGLECKSYGLMPYPVDHAASLGIEHAVPGLFCCTPDYY